MNSFYILINAQDVDLVGNAVEFPDLEFADALGCAVKMSDEEHAAVAAEAISSFDAFETGQGPGNESLACVRAVPSLAAAGLLGHKSARSSRNPQL